MSSRDIVMAAAGVPTGPATGQVAYTTPGTYTWVCPPGVTTISAVAVGCGGKGGQGAGDTGVGAGGQGGSLQYINNYTVTPGQSYTVVVGGSVAPTAQTGNSSSISNSSGTIFLRAKGGNNATDTNIGNGGSVGGSPNTYGGGGGAGGYGSGGGGGKGANSIYKYIGGTYPNANGGGGGGGGVGIYGQGSTGTDGTSDSNYSYGGNGGSGGTAGSAGYPTLYASGTGNGGNYGGASGGGGYTMNNSGNSWYVGFIQYGTAGTGAVRIIWPGTTRQFPSTNTGDM